MQFNLEKSAIGLLAAAMLVIVINTFQMSQIDASQMTFASNPITSAAVEGKSAANPANVGSGLDVIPKGVPDAYGKELGVSYDDISPSNQQKADSTISRLGTLDQQITLSGEELKRYIAIASQISCEYCCGVDSIISNDGSPACGCQHSFAMRGIAKYLIKNHPNEYTNDKILEELGKWKTLFFPEQLAKKAQILKAKGIELNYINLASNRYRNIEN